MDRKDLVSYLIAILAAGLPAYLIRFNIFNVPTTLLEVTIYLVVIFAAVIIWKTKKKLIWPDRLTFWGIILFLVSGALGVIASTDKTAALGFFKAYVIDPILIYWLIINFIDSEEKIHRVKDGLIIGGTAVALHAIWQFFSGQTTSDYRVIGLFGFSPNYLAMYLVPIAVLTGGLFFEEFKYRNFMTVFIYLASLSLITFAVYLTGSRAGLAAEIVGVSFFSYFVLWRNWRRGRIFLDILAVVTLVTLFFVIWHFARPDFSLTPTEGGRIVSSNNVRWEIWRTTVEIIKQKTFWGVGLGNFQNYFTQFTQNRVNFPEFISPLALTPHNFFLSIWVNLGLLGLVAFLILLIDFVVRHIRKFSVSAILSLAAMVAILAFGLFDTPYFKNDLAIIFWMILGLM